ncbi:hypothetical protein Syun_014789 [Stephania yunnanensis]|uniref:Small auxin up regulated protein n=1 Tax=Stephania yunnanensis TaxID=152371 RepID=A0AAP0P9Y1_9MAGN
MMNNNNTTSKSLSSLFKKISKGFHSDLPIRGHIRVCVGKSTTVLCNFDLEANYLNHPLFVALLGISGEELGYSYEGALRIACEIDLFKYLLDLLDSRNPLVHYMELPDLISEFYGAHGSMNLRKEMVL